MTLNSEVFHKTTPEVNTQIASYFDIVDQCIQTGDTNKKYNIDAQSAYSPGPPINAGSYTTFIISPTCDNMADLYNGFIRAEMRCKFTINQPLASNDQHQMYEEINGRRYYFNRMWFGFKDAMDAVEKYDILANGVNIYGQNNAIEESFITSCAINESVKRTDVFSKVRHKDVWNQKFPGCGCFVQWGTRNEDNEEQQDHGSPLTVEMTIPLKIDIRRFLPLSNIKYLPAFAGKFELRILFGTSAMVYTPCGPHYDLQHDVRSYSKMVIPYITREFVPIGEEITCFTSLTPANQNDPTTLDVGQRTCNVDRKFVIHQAYSIIPNFGINDNVYHSLVQRYLQTELIFPTQRLVVCQTSSQLSTRHASSTFTHTPQAIDSIFLLFPTKTNYRTVYKNPLFSSFQLRCGGYGSIPSLPFDTLIQTDPTFIELCQNVLNVNGAQCGINKEVMYSLLNTDEEPTGLYSHDCTNFFIGLPTETDNTFQQGQNSNTPITYEIVCDFHESSDYMGIVDKPTPIICFLTDIIISIHVEPNGMPPTVEIGYYNITE